MHCPYCAHESTTVTESQWDAERLTVERTRKCSRCSFKWATLELDKDQVNSLERFRARRINITPQPHKDAPE
jgi:transcriptional regulator NrdR family protein